MIMPVRYPLPKVKCVYNYSETCVQYDSCVCVLCNLNCICFKFNFKIGKNRMEYNWKTKTTIKWCSLTSATLLRLFWKCNVWWTFLFCFFLSFLHIGFNIEIVSICVTKVCNSQSVWSVVGCRLRNSISIERACERFAH